jgi:uncharacterized protein (DUF58 family)
MKTLWRLLRIGFHGTLLFVLPWGVGAIVGLVFDVREVEETADQFASYAAFLLLPILLLQLAGITVKVSREIRSARADGRRGASVVVDALDRHVKVLTTRGIAMAGASLLMVFVALERKFGQFAALAVAGLGLMYIASTAATIVSAFWVRAFDDRVRRRRGAIDREISPTVIDAGDAATERFHLARVPVPPGFRMHLEERLPDRLGGDTRFAVDRTVSSSEVTVSAPLPRTPRGLYRLGPAEVWYEDILGLTRVFVAARAVASLRVLPRLRPVVFDRQPRSFTKAEGSLSVLSRIASEEHYRTRPYVAGDDLRRVHWKQSINTGQLVIRVPEAVPYAPSRVRLVLDTFLPPHLRVAADAGGRRVKSGERAVARAPEAMDEVLDLLVEGWIALAHALQKRGEMVTLVVAVRPEPGANAVVRAVDCKRGDERKWRAIGSDAAWQNDVPLERLLVETTPAKAAKGVKTSSIIVSTGLHLAGARPEPGTSLIVPDGASTVLDPPGDGFNALTRRLFFAYPVGAEDNRIDWKKMFAPKPPKPEAIRAELARASVQAVAEARALGLPVMLVRRRGTSLALEVP